MLLKSNFDFFQDLVFSKFSLNHENLENTKYDAEGFIESFIKKREDLIKDLIEVNQGQTESLIRSNQDSIIEDELYIEDLMGENECIISESSYITKAIKSMTERSEIEISRNHLNENQDLILEKRGMIRQLIVEKGEILERNENLKLTEEGLKKKNTKIKDENADFINAYKSLLNQRRGLNQCNLLLSGENKELKEEIEALRKIVSSSESKIEELENKITGIDLTQISLKLPIIFFIFIGCSYSYITA